MKQFYFSSPPSTALLHRTGAPAYPACPAIQRRLANIPRAAEPPGSPPSGERNGPDFQNVHRNKRGITLNLKDPNGVALFNKLVEVADGVVENFRPDVKNRLGIDYESLKAVNKGIVLGSISGFGQDGPYERRPGFDQIAQGMGGLMSITGLPGQGPVRVGIPVADLTSGIFWSCLLDPSNAVDAPLSVDCCGGRLTKATTT